MPVRIVIIFIIVYIFFNCAIFQKKRKASKQASPLQAKESWIRDSQKGKKKNLWYDKIDEDEFQKEIKPLKKVGVVVSSEGQVFARLSRSRFRSLSKGSYVVEGEIIITKAKSRCVLKLFSPNPGIVKIADKASVRINPRYGQDKESIFIGEGEVAFFPEKPGFSVESSFMKAELLQGKYMVKSKKDSERLISLGSAIVYPNSLSKKEVDPLKLDSNSEIIVREGNKKEFLQTGKAEVSAINLEERMYLEKMEQESTQFTKKDYKTKKVEVPVEDELILFYAREISGENYYFRLRSCKFFQENRNKITREIRDKIEKRFNSQQLDYEEKNCLNSLLN